MRDRGRWALVASLPVVAGGLLLVAAGALPLAGCGGTGAPRHLLAPAAEEAGLPWGAWIQVRLGEYPRSERLAGEFLAVDADSLYLLRGDPTGATLRGLPLEEIVAALIVAYDPQPQRVSGLAVAGATASISHGLGFVSSGPIWLLSGIVMHAARNQDAITGWPREDWPELRRYARYPQGPPPDLHRLDLRPRPLRQLTETEEERDEADRRKEF